MVSAEHVKAEQDVHWLVFQNCKGAGQENVFNLELGHMNAPHDLCGAHSLCNP